jgi:hypothetical protein
MLISQIMLRESSKMSLQTTAYMFVKISISIQKNLGILSLKLLLNRKSLNLLMAKKKRKKCQLLKMLKS